jgi:hypothetical protein
VITIVLLAAAAAALLAWIEVSYRRDLRRTGTPTTTVDPAANTYAGGFPPDLDEVLASWRAFAVVLAAERTAEEANR